MSLNLLIKKTGTGATFPVDIDPSSTVAELKEKIAGNVELPVENIRLVCAGRVWDNVATIASYSPGAGSVVHCLNNPTRTAPVAAAQTLTAANPMQQMMAMGMPQMSSDPNDPFAQMEAQMHQQMMQNPEMMQQMMNSPMVQQMMSDPEMIRTMMRMNPRMNQLMEQRPEIARMLEDPEVIQQSMRMMQNPELMREMVRNQDRSLSNLDVMPGGHQALVNAHSQFLDPLHAAMSGSNGAAGTAPVAVYDNAATANNEAMPNPFAPASVPTPPAAAPPVPTAAAAPVPMANAPPQGTAAPNPMQQMMQQMMSNPAMMPMANSPPQGTAATNPMQQMMQQMMSNPAMMPMANAPPQGTAAPNPMQQMMQQMMSNPAAMQQAMAMTQQLMNPQSQAQTEGANATGGFNAGGLGGPNLQTMLQQMNAGQQGAGAGAVPESVLRVRFASQLVQLANMGFSDESMCLRALAQYNGRLDSVIDVLLAGSVE
jgi:ubiquilin